MLRSVPIQPKKLFFNKTGIRSTAKILKNWLQNQTFGTMDWSAQSSDLNPSENVWAIIKRKLIAYENPTKNVDHLWE